MAIGHRHISKFLTALKERIEKKTNLVPIRKGTKHLKVCFSYRPICLLYHAGKFLEKMILNNLNENIESNGGLSDNQFNLKKDRFTVHGLQ